MKVSEANNFLDKIQSGWYFATRYLDQEWSIYPSKNDKFSVHRNELYKEPIYEKQSREELLEMLTKIDYSYETFVSKLRKVDYYKDRKIAFPTLEELEQMSLEEKIAMMHPLWAWFVLNQEQLNSMLANNLSEVEKMIAEQLSQVNPLIVFSLGVSDEQVFELKFSANGLDSLTPTVIELAGAAPDELDQRWKISIPTVDSV